MPPYGNSAVVQVGWLINTIPVSMRLANRPEEFYLQTVFFCNLLSIISQSIAQGFCKTRIIKYPDEELNISASDYQHGPVDFLHDTGCHTAVKYPR
jgi:hypothetical protein